MGRKLKLYAVVVDDLIPVMIIGFGYSREQVILGIQKKFPAIKTANAVIYKNPIPITTSTIFGIDADMEILTNNRDILECINFELKIEEDGELIPITGDIFDIPEDNEEEKPDDKKPDKKAKWA